MPKHKLNHPQLKGLTATYGWDPALGFFVDVPPHRGPPRRPRAEYDALQPGYDQRGPLQGALGFLADQGFLSREDLEDALSAMQHELPHEMEVPLRRCAEVVMNPSMITLFGTH